MSDQLNHNILEQDIERLSRELREKKNSSEYKELSEREILKRSLGPIIQKPVLNQPVNFAPARPIQSTVLPDYLLGDPEEIKLKVEELIDMTLHKGVEKTADEAQKFGPYVLDAYHDALTDKMYEELKKRKII